MSRSRASACVIAAVMLAVAATAAAQVIQPPFDADYTLHDLGAVPGLPTPYGGLTFLPGDPGTLLIGGASNTAAGEIYAIDVVRDANRHVVGFSGTATFYCDGAYNDGGVDWGPGNVLFLARWATFGLNEVGQVRWGSTTTDKIVDLGALGVATRGPGSLTFVPSWHPRAGALKVANFDYGEFYQLSYSPDGTGTYDITAADYRATIVGGPEGFIYVTPGSPHFPNPSMLVSEWSADRVGAYEIDANADPLPPTRQDFITGLAGAEGAVIDPLTGDFLFSTFGAATDVVLVVQGFAAPQQEGAAIPSAGPSGLLVLMLAVALTGFILLWRRHS